MLDNLEFLVQLPVVWNVSTQADKTYSAAGPGDVALQTKLMLTDGKVGGPAVNIGTMVRFPTGDATENPALGGGTFDLGFSAVFTKKIYLFTGHVKFGYIYSGSDVGGIDVGDKFLYMLKADFAVVKGERPPMKELALMVGLCGDLEFEGNGAEGRPVSNTGQYRPLKIALMVKWVPLKRLFIRPRVVIPMKPLARGGKIFAAQYVLDLGYRF